MPRDLPPDQFEREVTTDPKDEIRDKPRGLPLHTRIVSHQPSMTSLGKPPLVMATTITRSSPIVARPRQSAGTGRT